MSFSPIANNATGFLPSQERQTESGGYYESNGGISLVGWAVFSALARLLLTLRLGFSAHQAKPKHKTNTGHSPYNRSHDLEGIA